MVREEHDGKEVSSRPKEGVDGVKILMLCVWLKLIDETAGRKIV